MSTNSETVKLEIPVTIELDLSTERELELDLDVRIVALQLGFKSVRHFEIAAKQALVAYSEKQKRQSKTTPAPARVSN